MSLETVEEKIDVSWNWLRAFVAKNQIVSFGVAIVAAYFLGAVCHGWPL